MTLLTYANLNNKPFHICQISHSGTAQASGDTTQFLNVADAFFVPYKIDFNGEEFLTK